MGFLVPFDEMVVIAPFVPEIVMVFGGYMRVSVSKKNKRREISNKRRKFEEGEALFSWLLLLSSLVIKHLSLVRAVGDVDLFETLLPVVGRLAHVTELHLLGLQLGHVNVPGDSSVKSHKIGGGADREKGRFRRRNSTVAIVTPTWRRRDVEQRHRCSGGPATLLNDGYGQ